MFLFGTSIPTEVICAAVSVVGVVISAIISWFVSRSAAAKEIEKMQLTWEREDLVSSDDEFAEMASAVAKYIQHRSGIYHVAAVQSVAAIRSKETGTIAEYLDHLYYLIDDYNITSKHELNEALTKVIDEKRKSRTHK